MLTLNTQNNNPPSDYDQYKVSQEIAGVVSEIPDGKSIQAAFLGLLWQHIFWSQMETASEQNQTEQLKYAWLTWFKLLL